MNSVSIYLSIKRTYLDGQVDVVLSDVVSQVHAGRGCLGVYSVHIWVYIGINVLQVVMY